MSSNKDWRSILQENTRYFENSRYDKISHKMSNTTISDILTDSHQMDSSSYRSFGTYRHDILTDTSMVKLNETYYAQKSILDNFYDINYNYKYSGIVLSKQFSTNGFETSLEDLFVEFGYDYLMALDSSYSNNEQYGQNYYFQKTEMSQDNEENNVIGGTYVILKSGETFIDNDPEHIDTSISIIEYDGTYCPTVKEILDGSLYIVIQSPTMPMRKIYFNNKFLPSLFINDDKRKNKVDSYVIEEQQLIKLCDICMYEKLGCQIKWDSLINVVQLSQLVSYLKTNKNISSDNIKFKLYFAAKFEFNNKTSYFIYGFNTMTPANEIVNKEIYNDPINAKKLFNNIDGNGTGMINAGTTQNPGDIKLTLWFGMSVLLEGYSTTPVIPDQPAITKTYKIDYYEWTES